MNYSAINYVIYSVGLEKEMFVIGGKFAAGLSEPRLARAMGNGGCTVVLYVSSTNFEVLKGHPKAEEKDNKLVIREGSLTIFFHKGIPQHWVTSSGYQVQNPLPLKQWLINNNLESWAKLMQDKPFEQRLEGLPLSGEEQAFKEACASHDWYSDYSDSARVVANGAKEYAVLVRQRDKIGGHAKTIFDYYSSK